MNLPPPLAHESFDAYLARCRAALPAEREASLRPELDLGLASETHFRSRSPGQTLSRTAQVQRASLTPLTQEVLWMNGNAYLPDDYTAFIEAKFSFPFPSMLVTRTSMMPAVIARSYRSLRYKIVNLDHQVRAYDPDKIRRDRIVGMVADVEFPPMPDNPAATGWSIPLPDSYCVRAILAIGKQCEGIDRILGGHTTGKRRWTVSQENLFYVEEGGFLIANTGLSYQMEPWLLLAKKGTPPDLLKAGWVYLSWVDAPPALRALYDSKNAKIKGQWQGRDLVWLIGGLDYSFLYTGIALTPLGREPEASIARIHASDTTDPVRALEAGLAAIQS